MTAGFLAGHPDIRWRRERQLAEMYWKGIGVAPGTGPLASAGIHVSADDYYAAVNWDVTAYWQRQAEAWGVPPPRGAVHVGDVVPVATGEDAAGPGP